MHLDIPAPSGLRPLLLLHGGGVAGWMWDPVRAHLRGDHRILVPDLPGHGRSADEPYVSHAETVRELIRILEREREPATVVGFSLGAQLAVLLAAERPDLVARVTAVSAQAVRMRGTRLTLALLSATAGLARKERFARAQARQLFIPEPLLEEYLRTSAAISRQTLIAAVSANLRFTPPDGWAHFPGPVTLVVGAAERGLLHRSAAALRAERPASTIIAVDGCGHGIPLQRPDWLAGHIDGSVDPRPSVR
ncbi:alpha/beta fold hydrolase [Microbacterium algeriense]|uniref:alpha/beta fold hydrolase n=1 Tax=Microbacterium algeriense TaxID=2615184 RepID=UPI0029B2E506|nr:alpha/beta fold hydrolase [Microbacterium algeriense]MDX2398360.1 alpha/beta hydrolase [Microbacterium algeriense]